MNDVQRALTATDWSWRVYVQRQRATRRRALLNELLSGSARTGWNGEYWSKAAFDQLDRIDLDALRKAGLITFDPQAIAFFTVQITDAGRAAISPDGA